MKETADNNFEARKRSYINQMASDTSLERLTEDWFSAASRHQYSYNFTWLGRPMIQFPQDIIALQEIVWKVKPDLIIETGIAHGGSLVFYSSILELIGGGGQVVGIDVEIREHNRIKIENHPMFKRITMIEGSSVDEKTAEDVFDFAKGKKHVMVVLDSDHTHKHVLKEIGLYSSLVTKDSYLVVLDTIIEDMPEDFSSDRPWGKGNNPKTAVWEFLKTTDRFVVDKEIERKLLITVAPDGYLRCLKD